MRFEVLLGNAVEGERRDTTLQARSRDAPVTVGTAPAGELFIFDPDHASCHAYSLLGGRFGAELPLAARSSRAGEGCEYERDLLLAADTIP